MVLLEDLHWADEGTLRWLDAVDPVLGDSRRCFVVATARPALLETPPALGRGTRPPRPADAGAADSSREPTAGPPDPAPGARTSPTQLVELVIDSAEGNPFYIEELVTWLDATPAWSSGARPEWRVVDELVHTVAVPSTLKGVLQSRLDALSLDERNLLQRASVVGRVFWDEAVAHLDDDRGPTRRST